MADHGATTTSGMDLDKNFTLLQAKHKGPVTASRVDYDENEHGDEDIGGGVSLKDFADTEPPKTAATIGTVEGMRMASNSMDEHVVGNIHGNGGQVVNVANSHPQLIDNIRFSGQQGITLYDANGIAYGILTGNTLHSIGAGSNNGTNTVNPAGMPWIPGGNFVNVWSLSLSTPRY